jgi:hypothetical protein
MSRRLSRQEIEQRDGEILTAFLDDHAKVEDLQASFSMSDSAVRSVLRKKLPWVADWLPPTGSPVTYKFQQELARDVPGKALHDSLEAVQLLNGSSLESLILNEAGVESDVWRFLWDCAVRQDPEYSIRDLIRCQPEASRGVITRLRTYANGWGEHHISLINMVLGMKDA